MTLGSILSGAIDDLTRGLRLRRVWMALAAEDIGDQHRRTTLGPLWLLINYLAFAGTFIFIFHRGDSSGPSYPIYVATGLLVWFYLMESITLASGLFVREESFIKGTTLPLTVYVLRTTLQCIIRDGYALVGCLGILVLSGAAITPYWLFSLLGVLLVVASTPAVIIVFAFAGAYFPDSQFIVGNLMRVGMFITPIFWMTVGEGDLRAALYDYNPFTWFLDVVRIPILEGVFPADAFIVVSIITLIMWVLAVVLLGTLRRQIALVI